MQGESVHALQKTTMKPFSIPPADLTLMADSSIPALPKRRAQANMQHWQPTHRSVSIRVNLLAAKWMNSPVADVRC
jgi:hypothetical protein